MKQVAAVLDRPPSLALAAAPRQRKASLSHLIHYQRQVTLRFRKVDMLNFVVALSFIDRFDAIVSYALKQHTLE
jgi:hypothetical protein